MSAARPVILFDVDGTLTEPRKFITPEMKQFLHDLRNRAVIGFVGGSDLNKQREQLGADVMEYFEFWFPENGVMAYRHGKLFHKMSLKDFLGEEKLQEIINFCLHYIADLKIPKKRGTFIEFRNGMMNVSPIGRNCTQEERDEFEVFDKAAGVRKAFVAALQARFGQYRMTFSIGGQISFDVFPTGWDKTYCLPLLPAEYDRSHIYFVGDKTEPGQNDYEIYHALKPNSFSTTGPARTIELISQLLARSKI